MRDIRLIVEERAWSPERSPLRGSESGNGNTPHWRGPRGPWYERDAAMIV